MAVNKRKGPKKLTSRITLYAYDKAMFLVSFAAKFRLPEFRGHPKRVCQTECKFGQ